MITLCMDTSHIYLVLALIRDDRIIARVQKESWKRQSEEIFPELIAMCESVSVTPDDIGQVVISEGPGSYTGVRIAMTVAKVFCAMKNIPLYTVSTLKLYSGGKSCRVVLDARSKRAYTCLYAGGNAMEEERACECAEIKADPDTEIIGDGHLIGREDCWPDIAECFLAVKDSWKKAENVHTVVPNYLKSSDSYLVKK